MTQFLIVGDTHGSIHSWKAIINNTKSRPYAKIIQVGDFGLWDHTAKGVAYLDDLNLILAHHGRHVYALGGNHENWDHWNWYLEHMPKDKDGFAILRSHIRLAPRVHRVKWDEKQFLFVAGAASIDKTERLIHMRSSANPVATWWPQEQLTDDEVDRVSTMPANYMFSHDCSNHTPWRRQLIPDFDSQIHRQKIDTILKKVKPNFHWHGHMHQKFDWQNRVDGDRYVQTYGLDADAAPNSYGILDTEADVFKYYPQLY